MLLAAIKKYQTVMRLTKTVDMDVGLLNSLLGMLKINLPDEIKNHAVKVMNSFAEEKGYKNFLEVVKDDEFLAIAANLGADAAKLGIDLNEAQEDLDNGQDLIAVESIIKCPHCLKVMAISDAPGLRERL